MGTEKQAAIETAVTRQSRAKIRLLLVDDHNLVRRSLSRLLDHQNDMEVVGEADNGRDAIELSSSLRPNLVIMDSAMPGLGGIEATRILCSAATSVPVLALSQYTDRETVEGMLAAGARGFVSKSDNISGLFEAIRAIGRGEYYLSSSVTGNIVTSMLKAHERGQHADSVGLLTNREKEVVQLISEGHSSKNIGFQLSISSRTVDAHRRNAMTKLSIHSIAGLTKWAVQKKLTQPEP